MAVEIDLTEYDSDVYALKDGHIAVSPFEQYPGELMFPVAFKGGIYKPYKKAIRAMTEGEELEGMWEAFLCIPVTNKVTGLSMDFDENDLHLNRWAVAMMQRWVHPFLTETPWVKPSGSGTLNGDQDPG